MKCVFAENKNNNNIGIYVHVVRICEYLSNATKYTIKQHDLLAIELNLSKIRNMHCI